MFDRRVFGEIIAAGYSVEILTETLDQILDLIRQNLVCNLREEDAEELKDVLVVERRSLIKQDSIYILQEAVTERKDIIKRSVIITILPFHEERDGCGEGAPLNVAGAVDVQPELGEQLEVKRHPVKSDHG